MSTFATDYTWTGGGDGTTWESPANWGKTAADAYPKSSSDKAIFAAKTTATVTLANDLTLASLNFSESTTVTLKSAGDAHVSVVLNGHAFNNKAMNLTFDRISVTRLADTALAASSSITLKNGADVYLSSLTAANNNTLALSGQSRLRVKDFKMKDGTTVTIDDSTMLTYGSSYLGSASPGGGRIAFKGANPMLQCYGGTFRADPNSTAYATPFDFDFEIPLGGYKAPPIQAVDATMFASKMQYRFNVLSSSPALTAGTRLDQSVIIAKGITSAYVTAPTDARVALSYTKFDGAASTADNNRNVLHLTLNPESETEQPTAVGTGAVILDYVQTGVSRRALWLYAEVAVCPTDGTTLKMTIEGGLTNDPQTFTDGTSGVITTPGKHGKSWSSPKLTFQTCYVRLRYDMLDADKNVVSTTYSDIYPLTTVDSATYTWQAVDGEWDGDVTDRDHWACSVAEPDDRYDYPLHPSSIVTFPKNCKATITVPRSVALGIIKLNNDGTDVKFVSKDGDTSIALSPVKIDNVTRTVESKLSFENLAVAFSGESIPGKYNVVAFKNCAVTSGSHFNARYDFTRVTLENSTMNINGNLRVGGSASCFLISNSVCQVSSAVCLGNTTIGGKIRFEGANPVLKCTSGDFRADMDKNATTLEFLVPEGGYRELPIQAPTNPGNFCLRLNGKSTVSYMIRILPESPIFNTFFNGVVPLIDWGKKGFEKSVKDTVSHDVSGRTGVNFVYSPVSVTGAGADEYEWTTTATELKKMSALADGEMKALGVRIVTKPEDTDLLQVMANPFEIGTVTPGYGIRKGLSAGETLACSASSSVDPVSGITYACVGYKVYTDWGEILTEGTDDSFTYVHPAGSSALLVWQWSCNLFKGTDGDWSNPANWSKGAVPTAADDVLIDNKAVTAADGQNLNVKSLTIRGAKASLTVGRTMVFSSTEAYYTNMARPVSLTVAGNLTVTDGAKLSVCAGELEDVKTAFADTSTAEAEAAVIAKIYAAANIVSVGGNFTVSNGATVYPANALLSGVPVFFKVKGDFSLAADASFDTKLRGWGWDMGAAYDDAVAAGFQLARRVNADGWKDIGFNLALGSGQDYGCGGGYGGNGMGAGTKGKVAADRRRCGYAYGYRAAPFLSGGPGGHQNADNRGSGSICVFAEGEATINGTLNADSGEKSYGKSSGGGIWIAAGSVSLGLDAVLTAKGGSVNATYATGGGGRIAIVLGLAQDDLDRLAAGEEPEGFAISDLTHAGASVAGGVRNNDQKRAQDGTAVVVSNPNVFEPVNVTANDLSVVGPAYGDQAVRAGVNRFEAPAYGADAADPEKSLFRYACCGYVLTNGAGETVAEGQDASFEATIVKGAGPYTLTWAWGPRESHVIVIRPAAELGTVSADGVILASDFDAWFATTETKTFVAAPAEGVEFLVWRGDVARGDERQATLTITTDRPQKLRPVLTPKGEPKTCVWKSNAKGEWYDSANWTGGIIPSTADTAQLANGTCEVYGALVVGSIIQTGGTLAIAETDEIRVTGDWTMSNNAKLNVTAQPIDATHTFETGTTSVQVGGNLTLNGTAVLTVISDHWTGGSPVFRVAGVFTLAETATVTADGQGFSWRIAEGGVASEEALFTTTCDGKLWETMAIAPGNSYHTMGSYGGKGGGSSRASYGWANAPIHPGSPSGRHGGGNFYNETSGFGGGLIRIHAAEAVIAGTLTANGAYEIAATNYGCASGGGIWLTADTFDFAATAKLSACGAYTSYGGGGGGRIAIGTDLTTAQVDALLMTGKCGRRARGLNVFTNVFADVTINVRGGEPEDTVEPIESRRGTFSYYGVPKGMMVILK